MWVRDWFFIRKAHLQSEWAIQTTGGLGRSDLEVSLRLGRDVEHGSRTPRGPSLHSHRGFPAAATTMQEQHAWHRTHSDGHKGVGVTALGGSVLRKTRTLGPRLRSY